VPQTFFLVANQDNRQPSPSKLTGAVGNLFMGIQIQCAECHQHPYTAQWGQNDFWGMAAFFGHVRAERAGGGKNKKQAGPATFAEHEQQKAVKGKKNKVVAPAIQAGLRINVPDPNDPRKTVRVAAGRFFESKKGLPGATAPYRPHLARWLTTSQNRYFAPAAVNRLWAHFFARGLVNPIDDMNPANKATHPALLTSLAQAFAASNYDLKLLIRAICNSEAYQRTSRPHAGNESDDRLYSHMPVKVVEARVLLESLAVATGHRATGNRVVAQGKNQNKAGPGTGGDPVVRFFDTREADDDTTEYSYGIPQILRMMNTNLTNASTQTARALAGKHKEDARVIEEMYLLVLSRRPSAREMEGMTAYVRGRKDRVQGHAGVMWALLNCAEFVSNH
jgi:hypothetical protein